MRYRLTTRGKIVVVVFLILLAVSGVSMLSKLQSGNKVVTDSKAENEKVAEEKTSNEIETVDKTQELSDENQGQDASSLTEEINQEEVQGNTKETKVLREASARIFFKPDKFELSDNEAAKLEKMIEAVKQYPESVVIVEGNINGYPQYDDTDFGKTLSDQRAQVVKAYLIKKGIDGKKIEVLSLGSKKPIENTSNLTDCWKNRRTDVYFKGHNGLEY